MKNLIFLPIILSSLWAYAQQKSDFGSPSSNSSIKNETFQNIVLQDSSDRKNSDLQRLAANNGVGKQSIYAPLNTNKLRLIQWNGNQIPTIYPNNSFALSHSDKNKTQQILRLANDRFNSGHFSSNHTILPFQFTIDDQPVNLGFDLLLEAGFMLLQFIQETNTPQRRTTFPPNK